MTFVVRALPLIIYYPITVGNLHGELYFPHHFRTFRPLYNLPPKGQARRGTKGLKGGTLERKKNEGGLMMST